MGIAKGSKVRINYSLKVDDQVIDSSEGREPLAYVQGSGQIIPGLEEKLVGLNAGDKKKVLVAPADGYGDRDPEAIHKIARDAFQDPSGIAVGSVVRGNVEGEEFQAIVVEVDATHVTLDMNHPLAGKTLEFDIEVVTVE